jgi:hypothetical protein
MGSIRFLVLCFAVMLVVAGLAEAAPVLRVTVDAGETARIDTPVWIDAGEAGLPDGPVRMVEVKGGSRTPVPCQRDGWPTERLYWILSGKTAAGTNRVFEIEKGDGDDAAGMALKKDEKALTVMHGDAPVLQYNHALVPPPEGKDPLYTRGGFIHPLFSPSGAELTRIHPADHIHHMGLWNPWTNTTFRERHVDFWNLKSGEGTVRHKGFSAEMNGPVFTGYRAEMDHVDLKDPGGETVAIKEVCEVKVWNAGGRDDGWFLIDYTSRQWCGTDDPIKLNEYRYGGFGFRATQEWDKGNYLTSEGKTRIDGHTTRSRWCIIYGPTSLGDAGIVFMSHPENHNHPEPMRIWDNKPEIFFNYCPIQTEDWVFEPGKNYDRRYRMYVYDGTITPEDAERRWQDLGEPPKISIEKVLR